MTRARVWQRAAQGGAMEGARMFGVLKGVGVVVVVLLAAAMAYAAWIVLRYWSGIGV